MFADAGAVFGVDEVQPVFGRTGGTGGAKDAMHAVICVNDAAFGVVEPHAEAGAFQGKFEALVAFAFGGGGKDGFGDIAKGLENAFDLAVGARNGAVGEIPPGVLKDAVSVDRDQGGSKAYGLAGGADLVEERAGGVPGFGPAHVARHAEGVGMLVGEDGDGCVVVDDDELGSPEELGGHGAGEDHVDGGEEGGRPAVDGAEGVAGPVAGADARGHFAASGDGASVLGRMSAEVRLRMDGLLHAVCVPLRRNDPRSFRGRPVCRTVPSAVWRLCLPRARKWLPEFTCNPLSLA